MAWIETSQVHGGCHKRLHYNDDDGVGIVSAWAPCGATGHWWRGSQPEVGLKPIGDGKGVNRPSNKQSRKSKATNNLALERFLPSTKPQEVQAERPNMTPVFISVVVIAIAYFIWKS
jgi:hypothetical protein